MELKLSGFPGTFWSANTIELVERAAYYAVASFVVIYLNENLHMEPTFSTFLNGSVLWAIIYFLPILSGTIADNWGFRKSLVVAFALISLGYLVMGTVQRFWPAMMGQAPELVNYTLPVIVGLVLIGVGGSIVKPCISGTVQKTSGARSTLGFGIFYMVINIGSMAGRTVSYFVRVNFGIPAIFAYVATAFALAGLLLVLFVYQEPRYADGLAAKKRSLGQALLGIVTVLKNPRFVFFLVVISGFWFMYVQIYNLIPLFLRHIDKNAAVELYTIINPVMIVCFQILITKFASRWKPVKSIMIGVLITSAGMLVNLIPVFWGPDRASRIELVGSLALPFAGIFILLAIAAMAVGEMMASPRIYEYIGAIAPRGQEGLFLGYANLPVAIGSLIGSPLGGYMFTKCIQEPAAQGKPDHAALMWTIAALMGVFSAAGLYLYDRFMVGKKS